MHVCVSLRTLSAHWQLLPTPLQCESTFNVAGPSLCFDIIALIIATGDISGDNKDTSLFGLQGTCSGLFSLLIPTSSSASNTVGFFMADPIIHLASSKKGFVKLLIKGRPKVVNYIHKLMNEVSHNNDDRDESDDHLLFQTSSQQFLVSTVSQSPLRFGTRIHWYLPCQLRFYSLRVFLTSTSHVSQISHCLVVDLPRLDILCLTRFE